MMRLLIADDHPIVREGLKRIIAECADMTVTAEAGDSNEVLEYSKTYPTDVILLDVSMPGIGFLETLHRLKINRPDIPVLVLSVHPEDHFALRALNAGAAGYLTKHHTPDELVDAIRHVYQGKKYVTPSLAEKLPTEFGSDSTKPPHEALSDREYDVLCRLATGETISDIATALMLSPKTISTYRARILEKMRLTNNADLVRYALDHALVD
ncbi:MAG: response regulator transcription factor [Acidiferrobacterales bacterium]|jgi:DNA-binding NarL/FixJ family response regulator